MKVSALLFVILFPITAFSQNLLKNDLLADLNYLNAAIKEGHPAGAAAAERLCSFTDSIENNTAATLTPFEYEYVVRQALCQVQCIHTSVRYSPLTQNYAPKTKPYFPYSLFATDSGLYITAILNDSVPEIALPAKVHRINNVSAAEVKNFMVQYFPADGPQNTFGYEVLEHNAPVLVRRFFYDADQFKVLYQDRSGDTASISFAPVSSINPLPRQEPPYILSGPSAGLYKLDSVAGAYVLAVHSFEEEKHKSFYKDVLAYLKENKAQQLVIDLRGNTGGSRYKAADFLSRFIEEPFSYTMLKPKSDIGDYVSRTILFLQFLKFDVGEFYRTKYTDAGKLITYRIKPHKKQFNGKLYVLIDGYTASSGSFAAAYLKDKAGAVTIGTETGGGATGNNGGSFPQLTLPNSEIKVRFPLYRITYHLSGEANEAGGVKPDHEINYTPEDITTGTDLELEMVGKLIQQEL